MLTKWHHVAQTAQPRYNSMADEDYEAGAWDWWQLLVTTGSDSTDSTGSTGIGAASSGTEEEGVSERELASFLDGGELKALRSCSGSQRGSAFSLSYTQVEPRPQISTGSGPFHAPVQGSFHIAKGCESWVVECKCRPAADRLLLSKVKKFIIKRAWFNLFLGVGVTDKSVENSNFLSIFF